MFLIMCQITLILYYCGVHTPERQDSFFILHFSDVSFPLNNEKIPSLETLRCSS